MSSTSSSLSWTLAAFPDAMFGCIRLRGVCELCDRVCKFEVRRVVRRRCCEKLVECYTVDIKVTGMVNFWERFLWHDMLKMRG